MLQVGPLWTRHAAVTIGKLKSAAFVVLKVLVNPGVANRLQLSLKCLVWANSLNVAFC